MVEVIVAMLILLVGVLGTVTMLNTASASTNAAQARSGATNLGRQVIETARGLDYDTQMKPTIGQNGTADNTVIAAIQGASSNALADDIPATTTTWEIIRRGIKYTVDARVCVVDDPKDKLAASHNAPSSTPPDPDGRGYFCPNLQSFTSGSADSNPDDYRQVTAVVTWNDRKGGLATVLVKGIVSNPTGGRGPELSFDPNAPTDAPLQIACNGGNPGAFAFTVTSGLNASNISWSVNNPSNDSGVVTSPSSTSGATKTWNFTWTPAPNTGTPDNTYIVSVQGTSSSGVEGSPASLAVSINCDVPPDPGNPPPSSPPPPPGGGSPPPVGTTGATGLTGGFNWRRCAAYPLTCSPSGLRIVDLEWPPDTTTKDLLGYRIYRVSGQPDWCVAATNPNSDCGAAGDFATNPDDQVALDAATSDAGCNGRQGATADLVGPGDWFESTVGACIDQTIADQPLLALNPATLSATGVTIKYYIVSVDPNPASPGNPRPTPTNNLPDHSRVLTIRENELNQRPVPPPVITKSLSSTGAVCMSWSASLDATSLDIGSVIADPTKALNAGITLYRVYRAKAPAGTISALDPSDGTNKTYFDPPYTQRIGRAAPGAQPADASCPAKPAGAAAAYSDTPPADGSTYYYYVTAVDQDFLESFASDAATQVTVAP